MKGHGQGRTKGPPHLTSLPKEPASISMTKRSLVNLGWPRGVTAHCL